MERVYTPVVVAEFSEKKALRKELVGTEDAKIFVWALRPGQEVPAHIHPHGQDTWVILQGKLKYYLGN